MEFYASQADEAAAVRRAAARAGCKLRSLDRRGPRLVGELACSDGWAAAKLLLALSEEDAKTPGARALAARLRGGRDDETFARALHAFVKARVRFAREDGEVFQSGAFTLTNGVGDCDCHFRLLYGLAAAGSLPAALGVLHHGTDAPAEKQGPAHAATILCPRGSPCAWAETTIDAEYGENPNDAADRLQVHRTDIAKEIVIMSTDKDLPASLPPPPPGFRGRTSARQVLLDAEALRRLGYLAADAFGDFCDPTDPVLRRAVLAFQLAANLHPDALLGDRETRPAIAAELQAAGPPVTEGFHYTWGSGAQSIGEVIADSTAGKRVFLHSTARSILAAAFGRVFGREPSSGELDFAQAVAFFETGYGRAGAADWVKLGQFAKWASEGKYNWGALEGPADDSKDAFLALVRARGLHPSKERGTDGGLRSFFYLFPNDDEAAEAFLVAFGKKDTLAAAASGSADAVALAMKGHGYYTGFNVGPGKLTDAMRAANAQNPGGCPSPNRRGTCWIERESDQAALSANVSQYAQALRNHVASIKRPGGVPDPAPTGGAFGVGVLALVVVVGAAATATAYHYGWI